MRIESLTDPGDRILPNLLRRHAEHIGDSEFLIEQDALRTYGEVDVLADRHANAYADLGITKGDTVAMLLHNTVDLATTSFGINRLGAIWSPVSTEYRGEWLGELLADIRSDVLVVDDDLWANVAALPEIPFKHIVVRGSAERVRAETRPGVAVHELAAFDQASSTRRDVDLFYGDTNAILWTSGTTGRSKGVMQSHNVWFEYCGMQNRQWRDLVEGDRFYGCLPMYNSGGWLMNVYPALLAGLGACIDERFSVSTFWDRLRHFNAQHTIVLGTMQVYLMQQPPQDDDRDNPVRTMVMVPAIQQILEPFMQRFGIDTVGAGFGQSEIMGATFYRSDWPLKPGSVGYATDDAPVETKLLDENDEETAVGEVGEFCVRPRKPFTIYNGYYRDEVRTTESWRNLWHHTGDLGRRDEDGELFFVDRKKDSLRHKGRNTATFEVEHIARKCPGVAEVAAIGVKLEEMQHEEELMVVLLPTEGAEIDPLEFCKFMDANAPYFFVPRYVDVVDELPTTPTNKVQKFKLREKGLTATTWDRTLEAPDWKPTR